MLASNSVAIFHLGWTELKGNLQKWKSCILQIFHVLIVPFISAPHPRTTGPSSLIEAVALYVWMPLDGGMGASQQRYLCLPVCSGWKQDSSAVLSKSPSLSGPDEANYSAPCEQRMNKLSNDPGLNVDTLLMQYIYYPATIWKSFFSSVINTFFSSTILIGPNQ